MVSNIPGSAKRYGKDIAEAAMSPIDTAGNLGKLGISAVNKLISGLTEVVTGKEVPQALLNTEAADAVGEFYGERYGGQSDAQSILLRGICIYRELDAQEELKEALHLIESRQGSPPDLALSCE